MDLSRRRFLKWAGVAITAAAVATSSTAAAARPVESRGLIRTGTTTSLSTVTPPITSTADVSASETSTLESTTLPPTSFSIFWITDTQFLSEANPALFRMMINWIVENWSSYNGKLVIHTGDLVQTSSEQVEWQNANEAMSILLQHRIPYTWCAGNHDDLVEGDPASGWNGNVWAQAFDPSSVASQVNALGYTTWAGDYHEGMNTAISFSVLGLDFLVVNVEWNAGPDVLNWVESLLDDPMYSDHNVILAPHAYIDSTGSTDDPRWGSELSKFVGGLTSLMEMYSPNVFLTLNGHFATDQGYNTPSPVNGRNELMFDRQDCTDAPGALSGRGVDDVEPTTPDEDKVGGATVMILTFDKSGNRISATTYDVYTGKWREDANEKYEITMFPITLQDGSDTTNSSLSDLS
jgi:hypothetical protein